MGAFLGKRVLVTGAGRGIGRAIALGFAEQGADVVLAARSRDELDSVAQEVAALGRKALVVRTDLADQRAIEALAAQALAEGPIDILVSNAALSPAPARLLDIDMDEWRKTFTVNAGAALLLVKAFAPGMA